MSQKHIQFPDSNNAVLRDIKANVSDVCVINLGTKVEPKNTPYGVITLEIFDKLHAVGKPKDPIRLNDAAYIYRLLLLNSKWAFDQQPNKEDLRLVVSELLNPFRLN